MTEEQISAKSQIVCDLEKILKDGNWHPMDELVSELNIKRVRVRNVTSTLRKHLPSGQGIVCELRNRRLGYRWIIFRDGGSYA